MPRSKFRYQIGFTYSRGAGSTTITMNRPIKTAARIKKITDHLEQEYRLTNVAIDSITLLSQVRRRLRCL